MSHPQKVRFLLAALILAAALAPVSAAGTVAPAGLVLRQSDVPAGYLLNRDKSGARSTAVDAVDFPELRVKYPRWGRVGGYQSQFDRGNNSIASRADVFRGRAGAQQMYAWFVEQVSRQGVSHLRSTGLPLGDSGVSYAGKVGGYTFTIAVWRYGWVFSVVAGGGIDKARLLGLARAQQRRVARALG